MFSLGGVLAEDPRQTRVWVLKLGMYRLQRGRTGGGKRVREEVSTQARAWKVRKAQVNASMSRHQASDEQSERTPSMSLDWRIFVS